MIENKDTLQAERSGQIELGTASAVTKGPGGIYPEGSSMWFDHGISDD
jgi:hypothetical protein